MSTTREVAERVVLDTFTNDPSWTNAELINAIDKALQAERERAAQIVSDARFESGADLRELVSRIREGKPPE